MKKEENKKGKVISLRISEKDYEKLKKKADKKGMSLRSYIVITALHGGVSPEIMVQFQNTVNMIKDYVEEHVDEPEYYFVEEVNKLWYMLNS